MEGGPLTATTRVALVRHVGQGELQAAQLAGVERGVHDVGVRASRANPIPTGSKGARRVSATRNWMPVYMVVLAALVGAVVGAGRRTAPAPACPAPPTGASPDAVGASRPRLAKIRVYPIFSEAQSDRRPF